MLTSTIRMVILMDQLAESHKLCIDAVCINCNKRFTSMRAISMHLRMTAARHIVNFINYGNYNRKTGLMEINLA
jgi:hypothetical protein